MSAEPTGEESEGSGCCNFLQGCCKHVFKITLYVFNLILFAGGIGIMGISIFLYTKIMKYEELFNEGHEKALSIVAITVGVFVALLSIFGTVVTCKDMKRSMTAFGVVLFILLLAEIALAIAGYVERGKIDDNLRNEMRRTLGKYHDSAGVKYSWDELQTNNNCCGQESYKDYLNVTLTKKKILVPESCCNYHKKEKNGKPACTKAKRAALKLETKKAPPKKPATPTTKPKKAQPKKPAPKKAPLTEEKGEPDFINTTGCYDSLLFVLQKNMGVAMAVALAVFLIQLSLVVLALVLPRYLPDNDQTRAFREGMGSLTNSRWSGHSRLHEQQDQHDL